MIRQAWCHIQQMNQGRLVISDPFMLPYLRALIEKVSSLVKGGRPCVGVPLLRYSSLL